jgi:hypothetical protein
VEVAGSQFLLLQNVEDGLVSETAMFHQLSFPMMITHDNQLMTTMWMCS